MDIEESELHLASVSFVYYFCVLAAYYTLQPLRDDLGLVVGKNHLPSLFRWSLLAIFLLHPLLSWVMSHYPRQTFVFVVYRFFGLCLVGFFLVLRFFPPSALPLVGRTFFIWMGVFNLFIGAIFWAVMADSYSESQGSRLFGFIAAGGTLGQLVGSAATGLICQLADSAYLPLISLALLEGALVCVRRIEREKPFRPMEAERQKGAFLEAFSGLFSIGHSPYLWVMCAFVFFDNYVSSFIYFQKQVFVSEFFSSRADRATFFSFINFGVALCTLIIQLFLTGRVLARFGVRVALLLAPLVTVVGFLGFGVLPSLALLAGFEVMRKALNYGLTYPAKEVLYTCVTRKEKYQAKSLIDTFVHRSGDASASLGFEWLRGGTGWGVGPLSYSVLPVALLWLLSAAWLGQVHQKRSQLDLNEEKPALL